MFEVTSEEFDPMFDEIGSQLKIKELQWDKQDLLQSSFNYTIRCSSWERNCRRKICY